MLGRLWESLISKSCNAAMAFVSNSAGTSVWFEQFFRGPWQGEYNSSQLAGLGDQMTHKNFTQSLGYPSGSQRPCASSQIGYLLSCGPSAACCVENCLLTKQSYCCQMLAPCPLLHNSGFSLLKMLQFKGALEVLF